MNIEEIHTNVLLESGEESRELHSPWTLHFRPFIFIPGWIAYFVLFMVLLKSIIDFINTTAGSTRILGYVIFVIALFAVPLLIKRGVEYLIDMKTIYCIYNRCSKSTDRQSENSPLLYSIKFYLQKLNYLCCFKVKYEYKPNENIFPVVSIV
ncbi:unnamed protein product [Rotaria socialis]